ncbi:RNA polymerase sigma factor [Paenibacillus sp. Z3-2]
MSGAHDTNPVYPDKQERITNFEMTYELYRQRICKYFSLKLNPMVADDLTQQVFLKAVENLHRFQGKSNLFTWIFNIAQNTVKNEYRRLSEKKNLRLILRDMNHSRSPLNLRSMLIFELILELR